MRYEDIEVGHTYMSYGGTVRKIISIIYKVRSFWPGTKFEDLPEEIKKYWRPRFDAHVAYVEYKTIIGQNPGGHRTIPLTSFSAWARFNLSYNSSRDRKKIVCSFRKQLLSLHSKTRELQRIA